MSVQTADTEFLLQLDRQREEPILVYIQLKQTIESTAPACDVSERRSAQAPLQLRQSVCLTSLKTSKYFGQVVKAQHCSWIMHNSATERETNGQMTQLVLEAIDLEFTLQIKFPWSCLQCMCSYPPQTFQTSRRG